MPQEKGDKKGWYVMPKEYIAHREYIEKYMPHYLLPFLLTYRSGLRAFETGLVRKKENGKRLRRVIPLEIFEIPDKPYCQIRIKGKQWKIRTVDVPFTPERMKEWYFEEAPNYKLGSFEQFLYRRGLSSHCGRKTFCPNMMILFNPGMMTQLAIRGLVGHSNDSMMETYIQDSYSIQRRLTKEDRQIIDGMLEHIQLPRG